MLINTDFFQENFGLTMSQDIVDFFYNTTLQEELPITYQFKHVDFILEVQYFLNITAQKSSDLKGWKLPFAVTSDGYELQADLSTEKLEVFQNEYGDLDSLGVSIKDMIDVNAVTLINHSP